MHFLITGEKEAFNIFLKSVFYVGKGSRSRPYAHFKEAIQHMKKTNSTSTKVGSLQCPFGC